MDKTHSYLSIDGEVVGLNRFVSDYLKKNVLGIISTLNLEDYNVDDVKNIELLIPEKSPSKKDDFTEIEVLINDKQLEINNFTKNITANSINAMVKSLKTKDDIKTIEIEISNIVKENLTTSDISLKTDGENVEINDFTKGILKETIYAMINSLKTDCEIKKIEIKLEEWFYVRKRS